MSETVYSDVLLNTKDETGTIITMLPITKYTNLLSSPKVITSVSELSGAPFALLVDSEIADI